MSKSEKDLAVLDSPVTEIEPEKKLINNKNNDLVIRQKRALNTKKRFEKLTKREIVDYEVKYDALKEKEEQLEDDLTKLNAKNSKNKKELYATEAKVQVESRNLVRKLKAIDTLEKRFEEYKSVYTERLRKIKSKINDYVIELLHEEQEFNRKLRQFWRNKDKLRGEKAQLEDLRKKFANISQNLNEDVELLERGYFTFGNNITNKVTY